MLGLLRKRVNTFYGKVMSTELLIKADVDDKTLKECYEFALEVERTMSAYREDSFVSRINMCAGEEGVECPKEVVEVIKLSLEMAERTRGLFDPTVGAVVHGLFGFGTARERVPQNEEIERTKKLVNFRNVSVQGNKVFLTRRGMRLDLGGIAKGWTAQRLAEMLLLLGAEKALVSVGGEICTFGKRWRIAIKNPEGGGHIGIVETDEGKTTLSTSGDYERFIGSRHNHHIVNPTKGIQENFYSSLTLVEKGFCGGQLDALTTACFNLPPGKVAELTDSYILLGKFPQELRVGFGLKKRVKGIYLI